MQELELGDKNNREGLEITSYYDCRVLSKNFHFVGINNYLNIF